MLFVEGALARFFRYSSKFVHDASVGLSGECRIILDTGGSA